MKSYYIEISQETVNYLQRLDYEISTRTQIIDRMMTNHKDDNDASVFESVPFQTYMKQLEEKNAEYTEAKNRLTKHLIPLVQEKEGKQDVIFDWNIEDFSELKAKITVKE